MRRSTEGRVRYLMETYGLTRLESEYFCFDWCTNRGAGCLGLSPEEEELAHAVYGKVHAHEEQMIRDGYVLVPFVEDAARMRWAEESIAHCMRIYGMTREEAEAVRRSRTEDLWASPEFAAIRAKIEDVGMERADIDGLAPARYIEEADRTWDGREARIRSLMAGYGMGRMEAELTVLGPSGIYEAAAYAGIPADDAAEILRSADAKMSSGRGRSC